MQRLHDGGSYRRLEVHLRRERIHVQWRGTQQRFLLCLDADMWVSIAAFRVEELRPLDLLVCRLSSLLFFDRCVLLLVCTSFHTI